MNTAGAWLQAPREHPQLPESRPRAHSDPTAVIPAGRGGAGLRQAALKLCSGSVRTKNAAPQRGKGTQRDMCRPRDGILGAALDHSSRSEKTSLVNISPSKHRLPTWVGFSGDYFLRKRTRELKGARVKSQTDKDEKHDTQSY